MNHSSFSRLNFGLAKRSNLFIIVHYRLTDTVENPFTLSGCKFFQLYEMTPTYYAAFDV